MHAPAAISSRGALHQDLRPPDPIDTIRGIRRSLGIAPFSKASATAEMLIDTAPWEEALELVAGRLLDRLEADREERSLKVAIQSRYWALSMKGEKGGNVRHAPKSADCRG
jgi:hypothetical protein